MRKQLTVLITLWASSAGAAEMKLPYYYAYEMLNNCMRPMFECDHSGKTCFRGMRDVDYDGFVGDVLDDADRTTVLRHIHCDEEYCVDLDTGARTISSLPSGDPIAIDKPLHAVIDMYDNRRQECPDLLDKLDLPESIKQSIRQGALGH
jgi:hypothetical protein